MLLTRFQPGYEFLPSTWNRATGLYTGSPISPGITPPNNASVINAERKGITDLEQVQGTMTLVPTGRLGDHVLKAGFRAGYSTTGGDAANHRAGNYALTYDTVSGVPNTPVELTTISLPVSARNKLNMYAIYLADQWRLSERVTVNLGLRWERQTSYVPEQSQEASDFVAAATYPKYDVGSWNNFAPRLGVAWDLTGQGQTVVKATYGRFNTELLASVASVSDVYNPVKPVLTTYRWRDPNGSGDYEPGEVDLSQTGTDFISTTSSSSQEPIADDFRLPHVHEVTASLEQELGGGTSVRGLYVYRKELDAYSNINVALPYEAYSIPLQRRDPGPDGVLNNADDGGTFTIWDYAPEYRGPGVAGAGQPPGRARRLGAHLRGGDQQARHVADEPRPGLHADPEPPLPGGQRRQPQRRIQRRERHFPARLACQRQLHAAVGHPARRHVPAAERGAGTADQRVPRGRSRWRSAAPPADDGDAEGRRLRRTLWSVEPYLDFRLGKRINFGLQYLLFSLDALNATNSSVAQAEIYASGPTFGRVTQIPGPRILRFGIEYRF